MKISRYSRIAWCLVMCVTMMMSFLPSPEVSASIDEEVFIPVTGEPVSNTVENEIPVQEETREYEVTLITGDTVVVSITADGHENYGILPAQNQTGHDYTIIETSPVATSGQQADTSTYVIPVDIDLNLFDIELFNIDYLIEEHYYELPYIPVIIVNEPLVSQSVLQSANENISALACSMEPSFEIPVTSVKLSVESAAQAYEVITSEEVYKKVWLDRKVHANLNESVPLIRTPEVWNSGYTGDGITIAVLDTGIDATHPALDDFDNNPLTTDPKVLLNIDFTSDGTVDDLNGHGTHCASTAAGNAPGHVGVAPGASLYNVKVMDRYGSGQSSWIIDGIEYAVLGPDGIIDTGDEADILSMSLGGAPSGAEDPISLAVDWAVSQGAVMVISAGNSGSDYFTVTSPGISSDAITVAASDKSDIIAGFSSRGPTPDFSVKPDVTAPGVNIVAARAYATSMGTPVDDYYTSSSGTSMAAPHVAGAAALIMEANPTIPLGWEASKFVKSSLMTNAVDLGYDVYTQGAGRITLPSSVDPTIVVDPPTTSFGLHSGPFTCQQAYTFYNLDSVSHTLTLSAELIEVASGANLSGNAGLSQPVLTVPAGGSAGTTLTVNTASIPKGMYSGRIEGTINTGGAVQAIFGFGVANTVTVNKIDTNGNPGKNHSVWIFSDTAECLLYSEVTNDQGQAVLYVPDGTYRLASLSSHASVDRASVFTFKQQTTINGNTAVTMDDRNAVQISFDPNKENQKISEKSAVLEYNGEHIYVCLNSLWSYPSTTATYVQPTSEWDSTYTFGYYPSQYYDQSIIDTPEWYKFGYGLDAVTGPVTFTADYNTSVTRQTEYRTLREDEEAVLIYWLTGPPTYNDWAFYRTIKAPVMRTEYFSPGPFGVLGNYRQNNDPVTWQYSINNRSYNPGATVHSVFGGHPFNSGIGYSCTDFCYGDYCYNYIYLYGGACSDSAGGRFYNSTLSHSGHWNVTQDGETVFDEDVYEDYYYRYIFFAGTPNTVVTIDGGSGHELSTNTQTVLNFTADKNADCYVPGYTLDVDSTCINLNNEVHYGNIPITIDAYDNGTGVSTVTLEYSLNDGSTWTPATLTPQGGGKYTTSLSIYAGDYVSLRVYVEDNQGNSRKQTVIRGFPLSSAWEVTPADGESVPVGTVDFDWEDMAGATGYRIQIDSVDTFNSPNLVQADTGASEYSGNLARGTWYWRVKSYLSGGQTDYSNVRSFRTVEPLVQVTTDVHDEQYSGSLFRTADGKLWTAFNSDWSGNNDIWYKTSTNSGETWSDAIQFTTDEGDDEAPVIIQADDGTILVFWHSDRSGNYGLWCRKSSNNGQTWSAPSPITTDENSDDYFPSVMVADDGVLWLVWNSYRSGKPEIWYKTSDDNGITWSDAGQLVSDSNYNFRSSITQMADGDIWVVWSRLNLSRGVKFELSYIKSGDNGLTWSNPRVLISDNDRHTYPSICQTIDGRIWLFWQASTSSGYEIRYATSDDGGFSWSAQERYNTYTGHEMVPCIIPVTETTPGVIFASDRSGNYDLWFGIPGTYEDVVVPPHLYYTTHTPGPGPDSSDVVTVTASARDEMGISGVELVWTIDETPQANLAMYDDGTHGDTVSGDKVWSVQIGPFAAGTQVDYHIQLTDAEQNTVITPSVPESFEVLDVWTATEDNLLVYDLIEDEYSQSHSSEYKDALNAAGVAYDFWDVNSRGAPGTSDLAQYLDDTVTWAVPDAYDSYLARAYIYSSKFIADIPNNRDAVINSLKQFMLSGGNVLLAGHRVAYYLQDDAFLNDYLYTSYEGYPYLYEVLGVADDPITDGITIPLANYGLEIDPLSPAVPILTYNPSATSPAQTTGYTENTIDLPGLGADAVQDIYSLPGIQAYNAMQTGQSPSDSEFFTEQEYQPQSIQSSGTAGLRVDNDTYKLVFLSFNIHDITDSVNRTALVANSMEWLNAKPSVVTGNVEQITKDSAKLNGELIDLGGCDSANVTFEWGTTSKQLDRETAVQDMSDTGNFSSIIQGLESNTTYYYRAKAVAGEETVYGEEKSFTTLKSLPVVVTGDAEDITRNTATIYGLLNDLGDYDSASVFFQWGETSDSLDHTTDAQTKSTTGNYSAALTGLSRNTTYYYRAAALVDGQYVYGDEQSFRTQAFQSIDITPKNQGITAGKKVQYKATGTFTDNLTEDITELVTWSSSDEKVAIVNQATGLATGIAAGQCTISAELDGITGNTTLSVIVSVEVNSGGPVYVNGGSTCTGIPVVIKGVPGTAGAGVKAFEFTLS
ncbi:MAG: S8 family serine peptidase, partial [Dehalococcoidales bacterium]|nr:S8 family serine peptidase [Dehalococcoidales bacterium]